MKITESQLRRITRQEVRGLTEMHARRGRAALSSAASRSPVQVAPSVARRGLRTAHVPSSDAEDRWYARRAGC